MSPRVQLVLHPDGDSAFAADASISITIDLPATYSPADVVAAVVSDLRDKYPLAAVGVSPPSDGEFEATWHVYRDGLPEHEAALD